MNRTPQNLHKYFVPEPYGDTFYEGVYGTIYFHEHRGMLMNMIKYDSALSVEGGKMIRSTEWVQYKGKGMHAWQAVEAMMAEVEELAR